MSTASRIRKRPVSFGNPALGTYQGFVYTLHDETHEDIRSDYTLFDNDETNQGQDGFVTVLPKSAQPVERMIAMVNVSPEQVPEGILNLARSHRPRIEHVRIMIAEPDRASKPPHETSAVAAAAATVPSSSSSLELSLSDDLEKPERSYLILFRLVTGDDAATMAADLDGRPYTSLDETVTCSVHPVIALEGEGGVSLLSPLFAPATKKKIGVVDTIPSSSTVGDGDQTTESGTPLSAATTASIPNVTEDSNCAVCLEHMPLDESDEDRTSILTTVCNHTFHLDCIVRCQDSPCPVCRYDHSGLNETLSQCYICGTTDRNYVCLICGVVACVGGIRTRAACAANTSMSQTNTQRSFFTSHASQHYDETLHAYALDTETQHVWDFAGQGYVHRLLQNKEDGKLVEVSDPNNTTSQERSLTPGLSDAQEGEVVHRKLEGFASQYYTLLKSQLEQQRTFYEGRLEEVRREFALKAKHATAEKGDFIVALKQEKKQLSNRLVSIKRKTQKVTDDIGFLKNMNESLEANKGPLEQRIKEAQREQVASREMLLMHLPALEEKVTSLMLQLTGGEIDGP
jgi:BRCA1-associated protein